MLNKMEMFLPGAIRLLLRRTLRPIVKYGPRLLKEAARRMPFSRFHRIPGIFFRGEEEIRWHGVSLKVNPGQVPDYYSYFFGAYSEEELAKLIELCKGRGVFADVGASIGMFSLAIARSCPGVRVFAFEPDPNSRVRFRANLSLNPDLSGRIHLVESAVTELNGDCFFQPSADRQNYTVGKVVTMQKPGVRSVPATRLDTFFETVGKYPDIVKIDVEGVESRVLEGMKGIFDKGFPKAMLIEIHPCYFNENTLAFKSKIKSRLEQSGFKLFWLRGKTWEELGPPENWPGRFHILAQNLSTPQGRRKARKICIVTPAYISSTPRVVKEADALSEAGFEVRVVFSQGNLEKIREYDRLLIKEKNWRWNAIGWSPFRKEERPLYWKSKLRYHLARDLPPIFYSFCKLAEHAEARVYKELARLAALEKADIYIGHYPAGLAAAAYAAFRWGAELGYDAEDLHAGERPQNDRIKIIEKRYLLRCSHVTAASELVADELARCYNITRPAIIHNVFPWSDREKIDGQFKDRKGPLLSLYWYSQVIGEDRGIQDVIRAAGILKGKVQIHLRGNISEEVRNKLLSLAEQCDVGERLYFHPPVPPTELLSRTAEHDVGLALEQSVSLSRRLSVTNKLFFYLVAGLAIAATDVPGQKYIMSSCPDTGFLYKPGDYRSLADSLNKLLLEPMKLRICKEASLKAARERWNWEKESERLIQCFQTS